MIGSTGVGKTEIARRLARMSNSPFMKVEASKFTEVGYVGRDVESMIRDLTEISVEMTRQEKSEEIAEKAELNVEERILDLLLPPPRSSGFYDFDADTNDEESTALDGPARDEQFQRTREKLRTQLRSGKLDNRLVELEVREKNFPVIELAGPQGVEEMGINMKDMLGNLFQGRTKRRKLRVDEAMEYLMQEEEERLIDMDQVRRLSALRIQASSFSMRSTRSRGESQGMARMFRVKACSATFCRSLKELRSIRVTAWCGPITFCSSRPAPFTCQSLLT
jgi:ATP-dependent HslUV protease ATP-binding subunit HslU